MGTQIRQAFPVFGMDGVILVEEPKLLAEGLRLLMQICSDIDVSCSRFRSDSDLSRVNAANGAPVRVSPAFGAEREGLTTVVIAGMALVAASIIVAWYLAGRAMTPLEDSYKRQQQFTSEASHELRTPLTIIDSGLQVLGRHPDQTIAANTDVLDSMRLEIRRLQRLVEDLLTLARSDNGALSLNRELVEADPLISEIYGDFAASTPSPPFTFSPCISTVGTVYLDPDRLRQLLIILIDNAVSHNPDGVHIRLTASRSGQTLEIVVEDDGIGIPPEQLGRVFERFHRVGVARHARGTGLGLPIAKWIVEAHGGSIQLRPKAQGLAVHVSIPLSQAPPGVN